MSIMIDQTRDTCESCGTSCCYACAKRLLTVCNDCGGVVCTFCRLRYGNHWYCCPLSVEDREPCHLCGEMHSPYCRPLNLNLCEECQSHNVQFGPSLPPIAAIRGLRDRDLIAFDAASYDETLGALEELRQIVIAPEVKAVLGRLVYRVRNLPPLAQTELGKQIAKL